MDGFNHIWKKESDALEIKPSDTLWSNIEMRLENHELKQKLSASHKFKIAACIILLLSAGLWVAQQNMNPKELAVMDFSIEEADNIRFEHIRILQSHIRASHF